MSKKAGKSKDEEVVAPPPLDVANLVELCGADGHRVVLDRNAARASRVVRSALAAFAGGQPLPPSVAALVDVSGAAEGPAVRVQFKQLSGAQLEWAGRFMCYRYRYDSADPDRRPQPPLGDDARSHERASIALMLQL